MYELHYIFVCMHFTDLFFLFSQTHNFILRLFLSAFLAQPFPLAGSNSFFLFSLLLEHFEFFSSLEIELFLLVLFPLLGRFFFSLSLSLSLSLPRSRYLSLIRDNNLHDSIETIMSHLSYLHACKDSSLFSLSSQTNIHSTLGSFSLSGSNSFPSLPS